MLEIKTFKQREILQRTSLMSTMCTITFVRCSRESIDLHMMEVLIVYLQMDTGRR